MKTAQGFPIDIQQNDPELPMLQLSNSIPPTAKTSTYSQQLTNTSNNDDYLMKNLGNQQLKERLNQILQSLLRQRKELEDKWYGERQYLEDEIKKRNTTVELLVCEHRNLKSQVHKLAIQLQQRQESIKTLVWEKKQLLSQRDGLKSIISYLQKKNQEISYELYQVKQTPRVQSRVNTSQRDWIAQKAPKYLLEQLDQQSIFQYTGNISRDVSHDLRRAQSQPTLQILSDLLRPGKEQPQLQKDSGPKTETKADKVKGVKSTSRQVLPKQPQKNALSKKATIMRKELCKTYKQSKIKIEDKQMKHRSKRK